MAQLRKVQAGWMCALLYVLAMASVYAEECADCEAVHFDVTYTGELWRQVSGGIATGNAYLDNLDLTLAVGEDAFGWNGWRFFGYVLYNNGHTLCETLAGSAQCISNIEAVEALRLYELWADWESGGTSIRFGLYDLSSEFDSVDSAAIFITPSHGTGPEFSQTGEHGPSIFPVTSLAVRMKYSLDAWTIQAAVLDSIPGDPAYPDRTTVDVSSAEGALLAGEVNYRFTSGVRVAGGYWRYTGEFDDVLAVDDLGDPQQKRGNDGAYLIAESPTLFGDGAENGVNLFLRLGKADARINAIEHYVGAGVVHSAMSASGLPRQLGVGIAVAKLGAAYREALAREELASEERETNWELTYRFGVTEWLTLQADVQYVQNPGMDPARDSSWTVGLRFEVARGWSW